ncbi:hypothetical protein [Elioraea thermophila]|uniref:hypothetical protein n=1 Tax=Elioraea thermophila TaxID=2185104 RepID=UPI000DF4BBB5|nr:hypothetical protein [Elioraea thermophila]
MKRLLVLCLLAACGPPSGLPAPPGVAEGDPRLVACRTEAEVDPEVRALAASSPPAASADAFRLELEATRRAAFLRCLEREGLIRRGGVAVPSVPIDRWRGPSERPSPGVVGGLPLGSPRSVGY